MYNQQKILVAKIFLIIGVCGYFISNWFPVVYANSSDSKNFPIFANIDSLSFLLPSLFRKDPFTEIMPLCLMVIMSFGFVYAFSIFEQPKTKELGILLVWAVISSFLESSLLLNSFSTTISSAANSSSIHFSGQIGLGSFIFLISVPCLLGGILYLLVQSIISEGALIKTRKTVPGNIQITLAFWSLAAIIWSISYMAPFWATTQCKGIIFMDPPCYGRIDPFDIWSNSLTSVNSIIQPDFIFLSFNSLLALWGSIGIWGKLQLRRKFASYSIIAWQICSSVFTVGAALSITPLLGKVDPSDGKTWVMMPGMLIAIIGNALTWVAAILLISALRQIDNNNNKYDKLIHKSWRFTVHYMKRTLLRPFSNS